LYQILPVLNRSHNALRNNFIILRSRQCDWQHKPTFQMNSQVTVTQAYQHNIFFQFVQPSIKRCQTKVIRTKNTLAVSFCFIPNCDNSKPCRSDLSHPLWVETTVSGYGGNDKHCCSLFFIVLVHSYK